jgi:hypothetical protein
MAHERSRARRTRRQAEAVSDWPPPLQRLVHAARTECPAGHAELLTELTLLAIRKVPVRGIFDPTARGEDDLFTAIEAIALRHLDLADARAAWHQSLDRAELSFERRDAIESAARHRLDVSDTAYFYTGLAFGLAFVCAYRTA